MEAPIRPFTESILEVVKDLPEELQQEVYDFAQYLREKRRKGRRRYLRQDWAGGLKEFRDQYTSLELQKKALEWRGD